MASPSLSMRTLTSVQGGSAPTREYPFTSATCLSGMLPALISKFNDGRLQAQPAAKPGEGTLFGAHQRERFCLANLVPVVEQHMDGHAVGCPPPDTAAGVQFQYPIGHASKNQER